MLIGVMDYIKLVIGSGFLRSFQKKFLFRYEGNIESRQFVLKK